MKRDSAAMKPPSLVCVVFVLCAVIISVDAQNLLHDRIRGAGDVANALGQAATTNAFFPAQQFANQLDLDDRIIQVCSSPGQHATILLSANGRVFFAGNGNNAGQNANVGMFTELPPAKFMPPWPNGDKIVEIGCGVDYYQYRTASGRLYVAGQGSNGRLGTGSTGNVQDQVQLVAPFVPPLRTQEHIVQLGAGSTSSVVLTSTGRTYITGSSITPGGAIQIFAQFTENAVPVPLGDKIVWVDGGGQQGRPAFVAVSRDGRVYQFGRLRIIGDGVDNTPSSFGVWTEVSRSLFQPPLNQLDGEKVVQARVGAAGFLVMLTNHHRLYLMGLNHPTHAPLALDPADVPELLVPTLYNQFSPPLEGGEVVAKLVDTLESGTSDLDSAAAWAVITNFGRVFIGGRNENGATGLGFSAAARPGVFPLTSALPECTFGASTAFVLSGTRSFIVLNEVNPIVECPGNFYIGSVGDVCTSTRVDFQNPAVVGNCRVDATNNPVPTTIAQVGPTHPVTGAITFASTNNFPVGVTTVTFRGTDGFAQSHCSFTVTVAESCSAASQAKVAGLDEDLDGYTTPHDCCDNVRECPDPYNVNPGAFEINGNGIDDNCNGVVDETILCSPAREQLDVSRTQLREKEFLKAMDMCSTVDDDDNPSWGAYLFAPFDPHFALTNRTKISPFGPGWTQSAVFNSFGAVQSPNGGTSIGAMSTGAARHPDESGYISQSDNLGVTSLLPDEWITRQIGDVLPYPLSCQNPPVQNVPVRSNDGILYRVRMRQPSNAYAFSVSVRMLSETPTNVFPPNDVCDRHKDFFLLLKTDTIHGVPDDRNVALDRSGSVFSSQNNDRDFFAACDQFGPHPGTCYKSTSRLHGTNYVGGTDWIRVGAAARRSEEFWLDFILFEGNTGLFDSTVLLDDYRIIMEEHEGDGRFDFPYGYQRTSDLQLSRFIGKFDRTARTITYGWEVTNIGPENAQDLTLEFTTPVGTTFDPATGMTTQTSCSHLPVTAPTTKTDVLRRCRSPSNPILRVNERITGTLTLSVDSDFSGLITLRLTARHSSVDVDLGNNYRDAIIVV